MRFVDEAKLKMKGGDGGNGIVAWRREKFVPLGGPAGGDGGNGGDVYLMADEGLSSLLDLKHLSLVSAYPGEKGQSKNKTGRNGADKIIRVPVGTSAHIAKPQGSMKVELTSNHQKVLVCKGGQGGFGNSHFKNPLDNAPSKATIGEVGEECSIHLTLKLMADVGLLGFPNAGKSTLLSSMSNAKPKVADYPFTTIKPMIGVCDIDYSKSFVMADIPGLVEGASLGAGLGFRFLQHLERVNILCHLLDATDESSLIKRYESINLELTNYSSDLAKLRQMVVLNKIDALSQEHQENIDDFVSYLNKNGVAYHTISAATGEGVSKLKMALFEAVHEEKSLRQNGPLTKKVFDPCQKLYGP